jgi:hypothetical protein
VGSIPITRSTFGRTTSVDNAQKRDTKSLLVSRQRHEPPESDVI